MFNRNSSLAGKETGMALAAENRAEGLAKARAAARRIALGRADRTCHADLVGEETGLNLGPAAGSIFRDGAWEFTGERVPSRRVTNHARELKVWKLVW